MAIKFRKDKKVLKSMAKRSNISQDELLSRIQKKAYQIYEKRGSTEGNDLADWFEAERQVKKELSLR